MGCRAEGWRSELDAVDAALVDEYQSGLPVCERPFRRVGSDLGIDEGEVVERLEALLEAGVLRRVGPVLNPPVIGSSTLAALRVPEDRFDAVAAVVNGYDQVNHNYERDHEWNMWFVVTAGATDRRDAILAEIEERTGLEVLHLPMRTDYYIDLEFPVVNGDRFARGRGGEDAAVEPTRIGDDPVADLAPIDRRVLLAVQEGFPVTATPYRDVAETLSVPVEDVLDAVDRLLAAGCVKRIGCVVNHVRTGFDSNCMVVWDVPDGQLDERGVAAGGLPHVTLCYHRPRRPDAGWPYNLFTMIHGRETAAVEAKIDELAETVLPFDHERLYSTATLKQTGARYADLVAR